MRPTLNAPRRSSIASVLSWASTESAWTFSFTRAHPPTMLPRLSIPCCDVNSRWGAYEAEKGRIVIWLEKTRLDEPHSVVSTLAHELGHVLLLADGRCDQNTPDHEPLTDLLAVYFGLGVFMANNALREVNWRSGGWSGWSLGRRGYLRIPDFAYALALYAHARGEHRPQWAKYLRPDVRALFKTESKHLAAGTIPPFDGPDPDGTTLDDETDTREQPPERENVEIADRQPEPDTDDEQPEEDEPSSDEPRSWSAKSADLFFTKATLYAAGGKHRRALKAYARALELNPCDADVWLHRAKSHLFLSEFSKAVHACSKSLEFDPGELAARYCRAEANLWRRHYAKALNDLNKARRNAKRDPQVYYFRGLAHLGLGNNRRAIADLTKARRFAPTWAEIYLARGRAYEDPGKDEVRAGSIWRRPSAASLRSQMWHSEKLLWPDGRWSIDTAIKARSSRRDRPAMWLVATSVLDRLVNRRPEILAHVWLDRGSPCPLGHENSYQVFMGVGIPRRAQPAVPTETPDRLRHVFASGDDAHAQAPSVSVKVAGDQSRYRLLSRRELIRGHDLDGRPGEHAHVAMLPVVEQHLPEGQIVVDG